MVPITITQPLTLIHWNSAAPKKVSGCPWARANISATVANLAGSGGTDTLGIGLANDFQLALPVGFQDLSVFKESVNQANEAVGTVDATIGSVAFTTAPDGTKNFEVWFTYEAAR